MQTSRLPTIRDLVSALTRRPGVEAAVLVGRDGLLIDGQGSPTVGLDAVAAHVPALVSASEEFSAAVARGHLLTKILEFERGFAIVATLTPDAMLLLLVGSGADLGALVTDIRRHRRHIASIL